MAGGAGKNEVNGGNGSENGGPGGNGQPGAGNGAGNPVGTGGDTGNKSGTGGLMVIYSNEFENNGSLELWSYSRYSLFIWRIWRCIWRWKYKCVFKINY